MEGKSVKHLLADSAILIVAMLAVLLTFGLIFDSSTSWKEYWD